MAMSLNMRFILLMSLVVMPLAVKADDSQEISAQIINGSDASVETFPAIASLFYDRISSTGEYVNYCGATILSNTFVLTAAHCVEGDKEFNLYTSVVPQLENQSDFLNGNAVTVRTKAFYYPDSYVDSSSLAWPYDIAIIELESALNISETDYVKLATSDDISNYTASGESFTAVGHGYVDNNQNRTDTLQQTELTISTSSCDYPNNSERLCMTGELNDESGLNNSTCQGDSGGPLYWHNGSEYVQVGITSFGPTTCGDSTSVYSSVFTEVSAYTSWIEQVMAGSIPAQVITDEIDIYAENGVTVMKSGGHLSAIYLSLLVGIALFRKR
jgi:secreted trypsin-like serine protease